MRKKLLCTVAAVAMLSGLFAVAATPALAAPPEDTQNFLPDDTPEGSVIGTFLSDKEDGTDQLAHLTNVSTRDTSEVRWFLCPEERFDQAPGPGTDPVDDNDDLNGCTAIGTDNTGVRPEEGPGALTDPETDETDEAYELFFDIPASLDEETVDVVAVACTNSAAADFEDDPPTGGTDDERNCTADVEDQVTLDDAGQGIQGAQTSAGEITSFCAISASSSADCELEDGTDSGTEPDPDPEVDANFRDLPHGSNVPNDRFTIRATSSIDVTQLNAFLTEPADAENDPNGSYTEVGCEEIDSDSNSREWQCTFTSVRNDAEQEVAIFDLTSQPGTGGNCTGAPLCKLDAHYVVSQARRVGEAVVSFKREGASANDLDISRDAGCEDPDTEDTNPVDDDSHIVGCFLDQFGAPRPGTDPATFESGGDVGFFSPSDCIDGIAHDHDDDGDDEHCHSSDTGVGDADDEYDAQIGSDEPGTQEITFCHDEENGGSETSPPANHGCADETVTATLIKTYGAGEADQVTLVFDDGDGDCEGDTFRENEEGETDTLIACVTDAEGNEVDTNAEGANGELQWTLSEGADDQTDTRFTETPPQETEESNQADVGLQAVDEGTDIVTVTLREDDGTFVDSASVEKQVSRVTRARSTVSIRHRGRPHRFVGRVRSPDDSCEPGRRVRVRRVRPGRDPIIGSDTTNANGRYRVGHNRTQRRFRYYAQVSRNANCRGDRSGNTPRVR